MVIALDCLYFNVSTTFIELYTWIVTLQQFAVHNIAVCITICQHSLNILQQEPCCFSFAFCICCGKLLLLFSMWHNKSTFAWRQWKVFIVGSTFLTADDVRHLVKKEKKASLMICKNKNVKKKRSRLYFVETSHKYDISKICFHYISKAW